MQSIGKIQTVPFIKRSIFPTRMPLTGNARKNWECIREAMWKFTAWAQKLGWVGSAHTLHDWTDGCIVVTNEEIDEIYPLVEAGTPVEIRP